MKRLHLHQLVKDRADFIESMTQKYDEELDLLQRTYDLGKEIVSSMSFEVPEPDVFKVIICIGCIRAVCGIESVAALTLLGNCADSVLVLRSIFDLAVNLMYIQKDYECRSRLYARYELIPMMNFLKRQHNNGLLANEEFQKKFDQARQELKRLDDEIHKVKPKLKLPTGNQWSGRSIKEMADEIGLGDAYSILYWILSSVSHSSGYSSHLYMEVRPNRALAKYYPNDEYAARVTRTTVLYSLKVISIADEYLKLNRGGPIETIGQRLGQLKYAP